MMNSIRFTISLCCALIQWPLSAESVFSPTSKILDFTESQPVHTQFQRSEWEIQLLTQWQKSPYSIDDVQLDMVIQSPRAEHLRLPCYYEGGQSGKPSFWRARFVPVETGVYRYYFELKAGSEEIVISSSSTFSALAGQGNGFLHPNDDWSFRFDNGERFRGIGYNIAWERRASDDSKFFRQLNEDARFNYASMLKNLAESGGNFFRTWMVYWNLPVDWKSVNNSHRYENTNLFFNPSGIERMEELIKLCETNHLYMMLTIDTHVSLTGFGWKVSKYNKLNGGSAETPEDFFRNPDTINLYKSKLRYLVARWGYSSNIAVWELFNEVDNAMYSKELSSPIPDSVVTSWHRIMAEFLKSIDPYQHLISTSVSHRDIAGIYDLDSIDFNQKHIYRNTFSIPESLQKALDEHKKPFVIGEFAYEWDWSKNFDDFGDRMDRDFQTGLWYGLFNPTPILPMSWWWEYFENRKTTEYLKHIRQVAQAMQVSMGKNHSFHKLPVLTETPDTLIQNISCGEDLFVYVENQSDQPQQVEVMIDWLSTTETHPFDWNQYSFEEQSFIPCQAPFVPQADGHLFFSEPMSPLEIRIYHLKSLP